MLHAIGQALLLAVGMLWQVGWSLILGFVLSGLIQALVSKERMRKELGRNGVREIALATAYGAASSSCSYAAAALSKTLFKKGAGIIPSLAFLFSSTNLVIELGIILYLLMGWQFTVAEWVGGLVLVALMAILVKLTYPTRLIEEARRHVDETSGHDHGDTVVEGANLWEKLRNPQTHVLVAQNAAMDWSMLRTDLLLGFLIAGFLGALVPNGVWHVLFLSGSPAWLQLPLNAIVGPLIAVISFVCSIGNVPLAAILWGSGISFGGVLSFLYADLIVLPLLDVYRKYYGWKTALYIGTIFFVTMVGAGILMDLLFGVFHAIPTPNPHLRADLTMFSINYTFWLNIIFGILAIYLWNVNRTHPMSHGHHESHAAETA
ncbi:MAG: permease [Candidatus Eremiobacteraeota bacterium]|nr:permease [Candidatus Eremiobacteraeota bacterium]